MATNPFSDRLRTLCLSFPEAEERITWDEPTYRVRDKIFAYERADVDRVAAVCKAPQGQQSVLVRERPDRYYVPPYVGAKGWVGVWLDRDTDWDAVAALVRNSYVLIAPRRLSDGI
jgi:predicted DNA-binding protein (MmcQ/YjbR family)